MQHECKMKTPDALEADLLARFALFLSTIESRNKLYRLLQYGSKLGKWGLTRCWDLHTPRPAPTPNTRRIEDSYSQDKQHAPGKEPVGDEQWRQHVVASLGRMELLFSDARKVYRLLQFLDMLDMLRSVGEPELAVRVLRRLRVLCFLLFYLLENYSVFLVRVRAFPSRHPRLTFLKRSCNGFWCLSILLAFPLDHVLMKRGSLLSLIKKLLDLPVAYLAFADRRVSDGIFGALGLASACIGVYTRWIVVMRPLLQQHEATSRVVADVR